MAENENAAGTPPVENTPTQTLFRFVSLRSPQLSDDKDKTKKFVLFPEELKDDESFYVPVAAETVSKKRVLLERASDYTNTTQCFSNDNVANNNFEDFKRTYKVIYDYSVWLARNKSTCTYEEFRTKREEVFASHNAVRPSKAELWNNLIYQVTTQEDFYIKEMVMQIIFAIHTLDNAVENEEEAKTLLGARIVLPKEIMMDEQALPVSRSVSKMASDESKQTFPTEEMQRQQQLCSAKTSLSKFEKLKKNLSTAEKKYNKDYQSLYNSAKEDYDKQIAPIIAEHQKAVADEKERVCGIRQPGQEYNPQDPCMQPKEIPYPTLPKFEFDFREQVSGEALVYALKPENLETVLHLLEFDFHEGFNVERPTQEDVREIDNLLEDRRTFAELSELINDATEVQNQTIVENTEVNEELYVSIGGVIMPMARTTTEAFTYQLCPRTPGRLAIFDLALNVPDATWDVAYAAYEIHSNIGYGSQGMDYYTKSKSGNTIFLNNLFKEGVDLNLAQDANIDFKITFTNGQVVTFTSRNVNYKSCVSGAFEAQVEDGEAPAMAEDEDNFIPSGFGFKQIGIADYLKVEQSTHAYVEGEVSNIENVMAREYREKSTRRLRRSENTTTTSSDTEREQLSDTTTANRYEMQSEISKMMQESKDLSAFVNTSYTKGHFSISAGGNYASHTSKEESTRQAVTQSQDVTARAMDRIVTKVHEERIEKIIDEFEENNSHGFDNRKGDKHVVGVYRWVDKLMKNQIYNYGKRMMFEFMIPEPAKLHLLGMKNTKTPEQMDLVKPVDPRAEGSMQVKDYSFLTDTILKYWVGKYNVELENKLPQETSIGKSFDHYSGGGQETGASKSADLAIPDNYETKSASVAYTGMNSVGKWGRLILVTVGNKTSTCYPDRDKVESAGDLDPFTGSIPVSFACSSFHTANVSINVKCETTQVYKDDWNKKAFKAIIDAYEEALVEYNNKIAEEQAKAKEIKDSNPNFYRQIENTVLRKNCISYMSDKAVGSTHGYGLDGLTSGSSFEDYETVLSSKLDKYTAFVKFMEQAFEWENISYFLYPYYWGKKTNWGELYQSENIDPIFRNFLQSGMARVVATVRPGFEDAVQFYLATGKIWNGGEVPVIGDELYLSIVDEMKEPQGVKEGKAWLTRLPTTLNILQAESIGLKVAHALPFTKENPDDFEVPSEVITEDKFNFETNDNLLGAQSDDSSEKIISGDWV